MFKWFKNKKKDNKGFTLVELVIVIAILAILVGLLAPQYTKYVEKSRKAADASNMDEMVKVIKVYAADPANELEAGTYTIVMSKEKTTINSKEEPATDEDIAKLTTTVKSQKWGDKGAYATITAEVTVGNDGGTSVKYEGAKFNNYMTTGSEAGKQ